MNGGQTIGAEMRLMAEREGIEPTKDRYSPSTVLKTAATTRHTALSIMWAQNNRGAGHVNEEMPCFLLENQGCNPA